MSDLLIMGLDAPEKCNGCCMNLTGHCLANKGLYVGRDNLEYNSKPDWCPAMNIQPHGRLIDADAFNQNIANLGMKYDPFMAAGVIAFVNDAPTIIPASK